ncbi:MAG: energy transducer TonB [Bacteroidales bacterium]|jgi:TonB family protein
MNKPDQHTNLFTGQGCLTSGAITGFVNGSLSARQEKKVKEHLRSCILCREAIEGTGAFNDLKDYENGISELKYRWSSRDNISFGERRNRRTAVLSVAATILLLIGLGSFFYRSMRLKQVTYADLLNKGIVIDSVLTREEFMYPAACRGYSGLSVREKKSRDHYSLYKEKAEAAPVIGKLESTEVYAETVDPEGAVEKERRQMDVVSGGRLACPYVIMSRPPSHLELKMPAEEYDNDDPFMIVEEMPAFQGEDLKAFKIYVQKNIQYPQQAIENKLSGRIYVQFTISKTGKLTDATVIQGVHPVLNDEVLRVLNASPVWQPGKQRGLPVAVSMILPVDFYLY